MGIKWVNMRLVVGIVICVVITIITIKVVNSCERKPKVISGGRVVQRTPSWVEVKPKVVSEIEEGELPSDKASEELRRLKKQVEWYVSWTAQLKAQIEEGKATVERQDADITLRFNGSGDWGSYEGEAGIRSGEGWHELNLQFAPIPLRVYRLKNGTVHIISPAEWATIGDVEVLEEMASEPWFKKVHLELGGGIELDNDRSPIISVGSYYNNYGIELSHACDNNIIQLKYRLF